MDYYENVLTNRIADFREQLSNITALGTRLEGDSRYQLFSGQRMYIENADYVKTSIIQRDFSYTVLPYLLVSDCGIYYREDLIVTRYHSFVQGNGRNNYYKTYFQIENYTEDEWFQFLSSASDTLYTGMKVSSYDYGEYEALIKTVPLGRYGTLYMAIDINDLASFFLPEDILEDGYFYVCDFRDENRLAYQYGDNMDTASFYEIRGYDPYSQLNYAIGIPRDYINILVKPLVSAVVIYIIFLISGGIALALFFSWKNNKPMRNLVISASTYAQNRFPENTVRNEHDYIAGIMKQLHTSVENIHQQMERQREEEKRHFLDMAVQGGGMNANELLEQFKKLFPELSHGYRIVIIIFMGDDWTTDNMQLSRYLLIRHALKNFYGADVTITSTYSDTIVFLLPEQTERELFKESKATGGELQSFLREQFNQEIRIAVSEPFSDVLEMPSVYAATLYQFRARIETEIPDKGETLGKNVFVSFDFMYHQQFFEALSNGEEEIAISLTKKIENAITSTTNTFDDKHMGEVVYRSVYMGNLSGLCNILLQVKLNYFDILSSIYIPTIQRFENVESFFEEIRGCCHFICGKLEENKRQIKKRQLQQQIMAFLNAHMTDSALSTQMAADVFHISDNTLQKIVRNVTGKTFAEYVEDMRIDMALRLLRTTGDSAESIATQCGFSSYNSMYKVFKRRYNLSPKAAAETME